MSFLAKVKVEASRGAVDDLIKALYVTLGNKVFMRDIEKLFTEKLTGLTPSEEHDLGYLSRAILQLK